MYHKKRKSHKKHHTAGKRRRRIGATGGKGFGIMEAVGLVGGAAVARLLSTTDKIPGLDKLDAKAKNAGILAVGYFFPKLVKAPIGKAIGAGMIAAGGLGLFQSFGVIGAMEDTLSIPVNVMAGDDLSVIAGYNDDNLRVIAGDYSEEY
jgi:hypothetical protein